MVDFPLHDENTAPEGARPHLAAAKQRMGFITTLNAVMAESPELLAGYDAVSASFNESSLSTAAKQVVLITASVENGCEYCVAAHSTVALRARVPADVVEALREGKPVGDPELEAVRRLTRSVVVNRGWVPDEEVEEFLATGHTRRNVLDVVLGVGMKTLSNYTNHIAHTPLDPHWQDQAWTKP
ncbi:carboxymuconolactone decarboxylase family protein [Saccharothrix deserti]|uniref:carboxymuconolactone decarboxylase family protein n=1 Tax=Saccharothrix deserti TaxID=2593674 RepID=UPI00131D7211|nr:carboxymuconolactone decarboxylase family protein [Saccharothrix deserti]